MNVAGVSAASHAKYARGSIDNYAIPCTHRDRRLCWRVDRSLTGCVRSYC